MLAASEGVAPCPPALLGWHEDLLDNPHLERLGPRGASGGCKAASTGVGSDTGNQWIERAGEVSYTAATWAAEVMPDRARRSDRWPDQGPRHLGHF